MWEREEARKFSVAGMESSKAATREWARHKENRKSWTGWRTVRDRERLGEPALMEE